MVQADTRAREKQPENASLLSHLTYFIFTRPTEEHYWLLSFGSLRLPRRVRRVHLLPEVIPYAAGAVLARGWGHVKNSNFAIFEIAMISLSVISTALTVWLIFLI
jgi:hypothetical protein